MELIKSPSRVGCLPTSLAMVFDRSYDEIIGMLGHDGMEVMFPALNETASKVNLTEPVTNSLRGFAEWEMVEVCLRLGYAAIPIVGSPAYYPPGHNEMAKVPFDHEHILKRLDRYMNGNPGIICGWVAADRRHTCAWDGEKVYDPKEPRIYGFDEEPDAEQIAIETFYLILPIEESEASLFADD